jgi:hypothetical protein
MKKLHPKGDMAMRLAASAIVGLALFAAPSAASAATIVVYADPMTLERRTVIVSLDGPDRAYFCMLPPAVSGCQRVPLQRLRS